MSLLRLLSTGKSLVSLQDTESRYRLTSQRLLPQFGPAKNPFSLTGQVEPPPASTLSKGLDASRVSPKAAGRCPVRVLWHKAATLLRRWKARLSGLLPGPSGPLTKPAVRRRLESSVQGELCLDRVRVVRNDLSDADLEVVSASPRSAPALAAVEPGGRGGGAWGRMTTRLFGVGKV